jgi:hypothetical protein
MNNEVKKYLSQIGRKGGLKSRRQLDPETARQMVLLREARRAFKHFRTQCFWSSSVDFVVQKEDIPWVAKQLMSFGGHEGWITGSKLCR